jgi:hypothetical protein
MTGRNTALQCLMVILISCIWSGTTFAASRTVTAIIPWQGTGKIDSISADKLRFQGTIEGIMYIETVEGPLNEAFVKCQIDQELDVATESTSVTGNCTIIVSAEDSVIAELNCRGMQGYCIGEFTLTGGTGRYSGISGSSKLIARSPVQTLAQSPSEDDALQVYVGLLQLPALKINQP